jgi:hypothetical protein
MNVFAAVICARGSIVRFKLELVQARLRLRDLPGGDGAGLTGRPRLLGARAVFRLARTVGSN